MPYMTRRCRPAGVIYTLNIFLRYCPSGANCYYAVIKQRATVCSGSLWILYESVQVILLLHCFGVGNELFVETNVIIVLGFFCQSNGLLGCFHRTFVIFQ